MEEEEEKEEEDEEEKEEDAETRVSHRQKVLANELQYSSGTQH